MRIFKKATSLGLAILLFVSVGVMQPTYTAHAAPTVSVTESSSIEPNVPKIPTQEYIVPDGYAGAGENRTIYWTKGITPPKMSQNPSDFGKSGYFYTERGVGNLDSNRFSYTFETGSNLSEFKNPGFYDINKTNKASSGQGSMCYLATAANMIHWWMDQNAEHIEKYKEGLKSGRYAQEEGLVPLTEDVLNKMVLPPELKLQYSIDEQEYWMQSIPSSYLAMQILYKEYAGLRSGGWMDSVSAFFFNGYPGKSRVTATPNPEHFEPDKDGGFFHSIFGKTPLAVRHYQKSYEFYSEHFKKWLSEGKAIGIAYDPRGNGGGSHAVTLWGAEYDDAGNLRRVYLTDSDDGNLPGETPRDYRDGMHARTMYTYDVVPTYRNGRNELQFTVNYQTFYNFEGAVELSLGEDMWNTAENDPDPIPGVPIAKQPLNMTYGYGAEADEIVVEASIPEKDLGKNGYLTYQWYKTDKRGLQRIKLENQTKKGYRPTIGHTETTEYYLCEVYNHKYGHKTTWTSAPIEIKTINAPVVDAATPYLRQPFQAVTCYQNSVTEFTVDAHADDLSSGGTLTYQWFRTADSTGELHDPVTEPSTSPVFQIPTDTLGQATYYCRIVNHNPQVTGHKKVVLDLWNMPLQVQVKKNPNQTAVVSFSGPLGFGQMQPVTVTVGSEFTLPNCSLMAPIGKQFVKWNLGYPNEKIRINGDVTLIAEWQDGTTVLEHGSSTDASWYLQSDGRFVIEGSGLFQNNQAMQNHLAQISSVSLSEGYTEIAAQAFADFADIRYLRLPLSANQIHPQILPPNANTTLLIFPNSPAEEYARQAQMPYIYLGELTEDGHIDLADYAILVQQVTGESPAFTEGEILTADINGDGAIDAFDLALFAQSLSR